MGDTSIPELSLCYTTFLGKPFHSYLLYNEGGKLTGIRGGPENITLKPNGRANLRHFITNIASEKLTRASAGGSLQRLARLALKVPVIRSAHDFGKLTIHIVPYDEKFPDYDRWGRHKKTKLLVGETAQRIFQGILVSAEKINAGNYRYAPRSPNCNAITFTLLMDAGYVPSEELLGRFIGAQTDLTPLFGLASNQDAVTIVGACNIR